MWSNLFDLEAFFTSTLSVQVKVLCPTIILFGTLTKLKINIPLVQKSSVKVCKLLKIPFYYEERLYLAGTI